MNMLSLEVEKIMTQFDEPREKTENLNFDKRFMGISNRTFKEI